MRVVHFAPFAPRRCGMYEAARDMICAECRHGIDSHMVDVGVTVNNVREPGKVGQVDDRGGFVLTTENERIAETADLLVMHTGATDSWVVRCQTPMVWVLHGRPLACYRVECDTPGARTYSMMADLATWPRIRRMITFWPEHVPFWRVMVTESKLLCLPAPPIDERRFAPDGKPHIFQEGKRGKINLLIADTWREDIDVFEAAHGAIEAAKRIDGLRVHLYAMERTQAGTLNAAWECIAQALGRLNALGEVCGRMPDMDAVYRSMDVVLTPHRIATRVMAEALSCGTSVVASMGCRWTPYTASMDDPRQTAEAICAALSASIVDRKLARDNAASAARPFALEHYARNIVEIYKSVIGGN